MNERHWAFDLIGVPYVEGGETPAGFNCWGLVRWVFINVYGIDMPKIVVGGEGRADRDAAIRQVETATGWRRSKDRMPSDRDILLMWGPHGRHVALAIWVNNCMQVLHAIEDVGVTVTPFNEMWFMAFRDITIWRKA